MVSRFKTAAEPLTRDEIVDAAISQVARTGDLDTLTIRGLAEQLSVSPMALYRHVRNKDDLLLEVCDRLLTEAGLPSQRLGWREHLRVSARSLRELLHAQPSLVQLFHRQAVTTPFAQRRLEAGEAVLVRDGFSPDQARRIFAAVHTYTIGYASLEAGRRAPRMEDATADGGIEGDAAGEPSSREVAPLAAAIRGFVSDEQFWFGLEALLTGVVGADPD